MAAKFKAGDRVRITKDDWRGKFEAGYVTTVMLVGENGIEFKDPCGKTRWVPFEQVEAAPLFAVGDRVRNTGKRATAAVVGHTATVRDKGVYWCSVCRDYLVDVAWDDGEGRNGQSHGGYYLDMFEVVEPLHIEEPKLFSSCEAAQVDVQREEYGPFEAAREVVADGRMVKSVFADTRRPAIVALIENGQPKPSVRPHVHASVKDATAEAERLAGKHPGKEFGVYELVTKRVADVVVREAA